MPRPTQSNSGRLAGLLLIAAGAFTFVNNYLPGAESLDVGVLNTVALVAVAIGLVAYRLPWPRWHPRASLALAPFAFALIAFSDRYGGVSTYSYAIYFVVVFVWVGIAHPPRTSWYLAPVAAVAYVLPLALSPTDPGRNAVSSVSVAIPVCVLVGETIARTVRRQAHAQATLSDRARRLERLAGLVGDLNADLDADAVVARICHATRELVDADAAVFVAVDDDIAKIVAVNGVGTDLVGVEFAVAESSLDEVVRTRAPLVVRDLDRYPAIKDRLRAELPGLHTVAVIPSLGQGVLHGALYVLFARHDVTAGEVDVATLLAGHAGAALANAATYAEVVRARDHEQAVIDGMADGIAVVGRDGLVVGWNAAAERLTGLSARDVVGGLLPFPVGPMGVPTDHHLPDGRWIELLSSPIEGETVVGFRDVSKAKALDEAKDLFLATTSHELKTPITVIKGYVAILRRSWQRLGDDERADALDAVADRTDSLIALVNQLLLGSRADASRYSLEAEPFDLTGVVRAAAAGFATVSEKHRVVVDVPADVPYVLGDPAAVDPVVGQLLENAIKYSPGGGEIRVVVTPGEGHVAVEVLDRGVGIPAGQEENLFIRFWQAGNGDRREYAGMGLGLHIVRQLVEAQGGTVHAANREDGGARIGFTLPYAPAVPAARTPREKPAPRL